MKYFKITLNVLCTALWISTLICSIMFILVMIPISINRGELDFFGKIILFFSVSILIYTILQVKTTGHVIIYLPFKDEGLGID